MPSPNIPWSGGYDEPSIHWIISRNDCRNHILAPRNHLHLFSFSQSIFTPRMRSGNKGPFTEWKLMKKWLLESSFALMNTLKNSIRRFFTVPNSHGPFIPLERVIISRNRMAGWRLCRNGYWFLPPTKTLSANYLVLVTHPPFQSLEWESDKWKLSTQICDKVVIDRIVVSTHENPLHSFLD